MRLLKYILTKLKCNSSCSFNVEDEIFDNKILDHKLSCYELKLKDIKKIYKILNKRERIIFPQVSVEI